MSREQKILSELERWASRHPYRDEPMLVFGSGSYSPRQMVHEIRVRSKPGLELLELLEEAAGRYSLGDVLDSFSREFVTTGLPAHRL